MAPSDLSVVAKSLIWLFKKMKFSDRMFKILKSTVPLFICLVTSRQLSSVACVPLAGWCRSRTLLSWQKAVGSDVFWGVLCAFRKELSGSSSLHFSVPFGAIQVSNGAKLVCPCYAGPNTMFTVAMVKSFHPSPWYAIITIANL